MKAASLLYRLLYACAALALTACGSGESFATATRSATSALPAVPSRAQIRTFGARSAQEGPIQHVVIVLQENRSFNYLFKGYPGATTASYGSANGVQVKLKAIALAAGYDINHQAEDMFNACDGSPPGQNCKMDGFAEEYAVGTHRNYPQYGYAPSSDVALYWDMAKQYALADRMFASNLDASFVSHQYIIAGQSAGEVDLPTGGWGCGNGPSDTVGTITANRTFGPSQSPCQDYRTLGDELDGAALPWRFYAAPTSDEGYIWSAYQAVNHIFTGSDWTKNVITPPAQFLTDVSAGTLEASPG